MRLLQTQWGDFLLNNAVRIDFFQAKEKETWMVFMAIDNYKCPLHPFETERDAFVFAATIHAKVRDFITFSGDEEAIIFNLTDTCKAALQEVMEQGVVE